MFHKSFPVSGACVLGDARNFRGLGIGHLYLVDVG